VKCVGHFGSVRAGGTQSNCSLEGKCDMPHSTTPDGFNFLTQTEGESRVWGGDRQMVWGKKVEAKLEWDEGSKGVWGKNEKDGSKGRE